MRSVSTSVPWVSLLVAILLSIATASWSEVLTYPVQLKTKEISGHVSQPLVINIEPKVNILPSGLMYTVVADGLAYPGKEAPEILSGIPETTITCRLPGTYLIRIKVNLVNKTSCGGASFITLLEEEVKLIVIAE